MADLSTAPSHSAALPRCRHCLSVYDAAYGDPAQAIAPGTAWPVLPAYTCPVCEAPAAQFELWHEPAAGGEALPVNS